MTPASSIDIFRRFFRMRPSAPRWKIAARSALSLGISVVAVWHVVSLGAGLITIIGAFSAVYVSDRPYRYRGIVLGWIVLAFVTAASLGAWTRSHQILVVPVVAAVAMIATFLSHTLRIGPPGAYMFTLACAVGTAIPASHFPVWQIALFVLAGGAASWIIQMLGAFVDPTGPESAAVVASARAVAAYANAARGPEADRACRDAARALHDGWVVLVSLAPATSRTNQRLRRLRALNREVHMLFAQCVNATDRPANASVATVVHRALAIVDAAKNTCKDEVRDDVFALPLGTLNMWSSIHDGLRLGSPAIETTARVGLAVLVAGGVGSLLGFERTYWAMAAATLVLHDGSGWKRVAERGAERTAGTLAGIGFVAVLLSLHPDGIQLVATLVGLQFATEMLVTRNYALAVVCITAIALLIGAGGIAGSETGRLLWARGEETILGCSTGMLVYVLTAPRRQKYFRNELASVIETIAALTERLADAEVSTQRALIVRRDLQRSLFAIVSRFETQLDGPAGRNAAVARLWPAVVAIERLGYKVLAACWALEGRARNKNEPASTLPTATDFAVIKAALTALSAAILKGASASVSAELPPFAQTEILALYSALV